MDEQAIDTSLSLRYACGTWVPHSGSAVIELPKPGVWFVHSGGGYDLTPCGVFAEEIDALRLVHDQGYGRAVFWPFGESWDEVKGR